MGILTEKMRLKDKCTKLWQNNKLVYYLRDFFCNWGMHIDYIELKILRPPNEDFKPKQARNTTWLALECMEPIGPCHQQVQPILGGAQEARNVGELFQSDSIQSGEVSKLCISSLLGPKRMKQHEHGSDHLCLFKCTVQGAQNTKYIKEKCPTHFIIKRTNTSKKIKTFPCLDYHQLMESF